MWSWNVFPSSAIWATHLVPEEVWIRQLELGCDVLGLSSRSYRPFWRPVVRHIAWRERFLGPVSRVCWHMGLRHGQWRLRICIAWREQSAWWWDECVVCLWRIGSEVRSCTAFWVFRAWQRWWGMVDWGGSGMWNVRLEMTRVSACRNVVVAGVRCVGRSSIMNRVFRHILSSISSRIVTNNISTGRHQVFTRTWKRMLRLTFVLYLTTESL